MDGADDTSDEDGSDVSDDNIDGDDDDLDKGDDDKETDNEGGAEEEPLNSEDDVTDEDDAPDLFDSENVVVCQYDKVILILLEVFQNKNLFISTLFRLLVLEISGSFI